jgi:hypothetical protein
MGETIVAQFSAPASLSIRGYRSVGSFDGIVVDLDPAVGQEAPKANPVFGEIGERFAERSCQRRARSTV